MVDAVLKNVRLRPVPISLQALPTIISYSDGEGGSAGVFVAAWLPWLDHPIAAYTQVPQRIRTMWAELAGRADYKVIFLIEAIGPLLLSIAFPRVMRDALWVNFIDNAAAEASLIAGSSALQAADHIVGLT